VFSLQAGDCVHMNTQLGHNIVNKSKGTATILWVGTPVLLPVE
ncbi:MAG TPA: XRE family transcriptional regulator, partial [Halieaceae bacterium]|nr:XRE family transcriptional regulator [Halieaceae bacterium]